MKITPTPKKPCVAKPPVILPTVPSQLIRLALNDLRKCEKQPDKFTINMSRWLITNGKCQVCLAGAVMAQRLNGKVLAKTCHSREVEPFLFSGNNEQLRALDLFRLGDIYAGCYYLSRTSNLSQRFDITQYFDNKVAFYVDMEQLAVDFEKEGN